MVFRRQTMQQNRSIRYSTAKEVKVSLIFTRLNEIDTINEKFSCEATMFATWYDDINALRKHDTDEDSYFWDPDNHWDPQLYIDNAIGEVKEKDVKFRIEKYFDEQLKEHFLEINMIKRIQGVFFEKLELYHFPFDVQDLSITVTSHRPSSEIYINQDYNNQSKITKHASLDKHIWKLHEHINVKLHTITNDFQLFDDSDGSYSHSAITIQCRVARKPGYFVVNCLLPTLMITLCVFFTFLMDYERYHYRFSLLFTTMLTSITFRWAIHGRSIPTVSYLTFLDMYSVSSIFVVFSTMVWHAIYSIMYKENPELAIKSDYYAMCSFGMAVLFLHLLQFVWFCIAIHRRNELDRLDKTAALDHKKIRNSLIQNGNSSINNNNINNQTNNNNCNKVYYSFSKLQNSALTVLKLNSNEASNYKKKLINNLENSANSSNNTQHSITSEILITNEYTTTTNSTSLNSNNNEKFCYQYAPLVQQSSKDSKD